MCWKITIQFRAMPYNGHCSRSSHPGQLESMLCSHCYAGAEHAQRTDYNRAKSCDEMPPNLFVYLPIGPYRAYNTFPGRVRFIYSAVDVPHICHVPLYSALLCSILCIHMCVCGAVLRLQSFVSPSRRGNQAPPNAYLVYFYYRPSNTSNNDFA